MKTLSHFGHTHFGFKSKYMSIWSSTHIDSTPVSTPQVFDGCGWMHVQFNSFNEDQADLHRLEGKTCDQKEKKKSRAIYKKT